MKGKKVKIKWIWGLCSVNCDYQNGWNNLYLGGAQVYVLVHCALSRFQISIVWEFMSDYNAKFANVEFTVIVLCITCKVFCLLRQLGENFSKSILHYAKQPQEKQLRQKDWSLRILIVTAKKNMSYKNYLFLELI